MRELLLQRRLRKQEYVQMFDVVKTRLSGNSLGSKVSMSGLALLLMFATTAQMQLGCASSANTGGGATGGSTSAGGTSGTGGTTNVGGTTSAGGATGAGGATSAGGTMIAGGATSAGGSATGTGGATSAGGSVTGTGGATTGTGGATSAGGSVTGTGGATTGAGGATNAGGETGAGGAVAGACSGIVLTPDAKGYVAKTTNTIGINGSWFEYSDCVDLGGKNCSTVTTPPNGSFPNTGGKMCTSGQTSTAGWGAGIALELNDAAGQQPWDSTANGVKGFCFQISGNTIPSFRLAFPTKNSGDYPWVYPISAAGTYSVTWDMLTQQSWEQKKAWEPTLIMLLQLQIPSTTTAPVPWDFCISGVTAIK